MVDNEIFGLCPDCGQVVDVIGMGVVNLLEPLDRYLR